LIEVFCAFPPFQVPRTVEIRADISAIEVKPAHDAQIGTLSKPSRNAVPLFQTTDAKRRVWEALLKVAAFSGDIEGFTFKN
jgi:hypothetical protein